jgi:hypothetical protein
MKEIANLTKPLYTVRSMTKMEATTMYTVRNFKTKKQFKEAVANDEKVRLFAPGMGAPAENGREFVEGPHYPEPHKWYAEVQMQDGIVVKVK